MFKNRYIWYWLWIIISRIVPVTIIGIEYGVFTTETTVSYKFGFAFVFVVLWALFRFWEDLKRMAKEMNEGFMREFIVATTEVGPYLLLFGIGWIASSLAEDFLFISGVLLVSNLVGAVARANHLKLRRKDLLERGWVNVLQ
jgi:hypothetical protein